MKRAHKAIRKVRQPPRAKTERAAVPSAQQPYHMLVYIASAVQSKTRWRLLPAALHADVSYRR
jgi:hypothetical protein